ncbi:MAG: hypothetical protein RR734_04130 [Bacilli bacterium]
MENVIDSKERIARSNIYSIFGKFVCYQINNNNDGEILLKKVGLSSFLKEFDDKLTPFHYNGGFQNENQKYNPTYVCLTICERIEGKEEVLLCFLNTILEGIKEIDRKEYTKLSNFLNVIGYELLSKKEKEDYHLIYYKLVPSSKGVQVRNEDISYLQNMLSKYHSDIFLIYEEAILNFGNGQYVSCIENCRSMFECFFKKLDLIHSNYINGILNATGETIYYKEEKLTSIQKIYKYWLENRKGANRFRLFQTIYSVMSGLGTHREDSASKEDALLLLRYVEDCFLWCFRKGINC